MRRMLFRAFAALMVLAVIVSCAPSSPTPPPAEPAAPTVAAPAGQDEPTVAPAPESEEPYKVLFWEHAPWTRVPLPTKEEDFVYQYILENYNLDIEIQTAPEGLTESDAVAKLNAMIGSGTIPDFIEAYWTVGTPLVQQYIDQGILVPINDYLDAAPYLKSYLSPAELAYLTLDGNQYAVAQPRPRENWDTIWIRKDWLDKLGLPLPKTVEELADAAKAFTTQDPDGNGQDDTYGFTATSNFGQMQSIFAPFGAYPGRNNIRIANNQVIFDAFSPEAKQALAWWKAQIDAGVVDPNWTTNNIEQWRDAVSQGKAGIVTAQFQMLRFCSSTACLGDAIQAGTPEADWVQLPSPEGPFGKYACWQGSLIDVPFWFTRQAESEPGKMEAIIRFFNDVMNPETELYRMAAYGIEGLTYRADENGRRIEQIRPPELDWLSYWAVFRCGDDDNFWYYHLENVYSPTGEERNLWDYQEVSINEPKIKNVTPLWVSHEAWPDLQVYMQEMHMKFATGEESLDNWDAFVEEAKSTYRLQEILDDATEQFKALGLIQ